MGGSVGLGLFMQLNKQVQKLMPVQGITPLISAYQNGVALITRMFIAIFRS